MISVIVPAYNAAGTIDACLHALACQAVPPGTYEVLVVDDGSTDATAAIVESQPVARLIRQTHAGASEARNRGLREARGDIVLFTDADCEPLPDWIEHISAPFVDSEVAGAKGVYLTRQHSPVARFVQAEHEEKYDRLAVSEQIDFVDTYSAAYRREVVLAQGGFDAGLPICEDQELSYRLAESGHRLVFVPGAAVYHNHQSTPWGYALRKAEIGRWKVQVHARHPAKAYRDSYTPWTQKAQLLLLPLVGALAAAAAFGWISWLFAAAAALAGLLTILPLARKCARQGPLVLLLCPLLVLLRALALEAGVLIGMVAIWIGASTRHAVAKRLWSVLAWAAALSLAAVAVWLSLRHVRWAGLTRALAHPNWLLIGLALTTVLATTLAKAARWQALLRRCRTRAGMGKIVRVLLIGQMGNSFLPGRMGDLARVVLMGPQSQAGMLGVLGTLVVEKALDGVMILLTLVGLALWTPLPGWLRRPALGLALATGILLGLVIWAALRRAGAGRGAQALIGRLSSHVQSKVALWLERLGVGLGLLREPGDALLALGWSAVVWALAALTNVLLLKALGVPAPGWSTWLVLVTGYVATFLPAVPGQVGVFEYAAVLALSAAGVGREPALAFGLVLHLLVYGPPAVLGLASMAIEGLTWDALRQVPAQAEERTTRPG